MVNSPKWKEYRVGSLDTVRARTRNYVEGALSGLKAKRADLLAKLREAAPSANGESA